MGAGYQKLLLARLNVAQRGRNPSRSVIWRRLSKRDSDILTLLSVGMGPVSTCACSQVVEYGNEESVGEAIRASGIPRDQFWITTKWSDGAISVRESCQASLKKLGVDYIDLYMVHHEWTCNGDPVGAWKQMEEMVDEGFVRNIGLSA